MFRLLALAGLAVTLLGSPTALAQNATFYTVTYIEVGPILSKVGAAALRDYRNAGRKDDGNFGLELLQRIEHANQFAVLGAWVDQKAFEAHSAQAHSKTMQEKIAAISAAPSDTRQHQALSVAPAKSGRDAVFAVTHVDVVPPQKDNGAAALKQLAEDSRQHSGNLEFDVWQQTDRPNHFTVVEAWGSRGALNVHVMQKETREFRIKLAPMSGALYDKRLYKVLR
ncbi:MAG: antibiotic biosynthesis monooxygenase [Xanthobacteraceae bacterium]